MAQAAQNTTSEKPLGKQSIKELQETAKALGLATRGPKAKILERITSLREKEAALARPAAEKLAEEPKQGGRKPSTRSERLEEVHGYVAQIQTKAGEIKADDKEGWHAIEKLANRIFDRAYRSRKEL